MHRIEMKINGLDYLLLFLLLLFLLGATSPTSDFTVSDVTIPWSVSLSVCHICALWLCSNDRRCQHNVFRIWQAYVSPTLC